MCQKCTFSFLQYSFLCLILSDTSLFQIFTLHTPLPVYFDKTSDRVPYENILLDILHILYNAMSHLHTFFIRNALFGLLSSNVAQRNSNIPKIDITLPDKKAFKMLLRNSAIIWQMYWSLVLNIFQDLCFRIQASVSQASVAYKSVAYKKICTERKCNFQMVPFLAVLEYIKPIEKLI